eukprot:6488616-Amphidinium_carterae.2
MLTERRPEIKGRHTPLDKQGSSQSAEMSLHGRQGKDRGTSAYACRCMFDGTVQHHTVRFRARRDA